MGDCRCWRSGPARRSCCFASRRPPSCRRRRSSRPSSALCRMPHSPRRRCSRTMERLTAAAFGQRRKMLRGALKGAWRRGVAARDAGISPDRRAETLTRGRIRPAGAPDIASRRCTRCVGVILSGDAAGYCLMAKGLDARSHAEGLRLREIRVIRAWAVSPARRMAQQPPARPGSDGEAWRPRGMAPERRQLSAG